MHLTRKTLTRWLSGLLTLCLVVMLLPSLSAGALWEDIQGHPEQTALQAFIDKGYLLGCGDGTIQPDRTIKRAEFATLVNRVAGYRIQSQDMARFTDISPEAWYYSALAIAYEAKYMIGNSESTMNPEGTITAEEVDIVISRLAGREHTVTDTTPLTRAQIVAQLYANLDAIEGKGRPTGEVYALMNIPYSAFYGAENIATGDIDAIASATNKTGNYGKAGATFHNGGTAEIAEDGTVTAVGGANDSTIQGVTWPVKVDASVLSTLGGAEVTDESRLTTATLGRGQTSSNTLVGYQTLTEQPAYSYYILSEAPAYYMELTLDNGTPVFSAVQGAPVAESAIDATVSYGTRWGDVQLNVADAADANGKLINAIALTTADGKTGLIHLGQIWSYSDLAWKAALVSGLDGTTITNVRYYCSVQDEDLTDTVAPAYANYVYDYPVNLEIAQVWQGEVTAAFTGAESIAITGLPEDAVNPTATVYYTTGGRGATYEYLTPMEVDPADDDIDPVSVPVVNGVISIAPGSVTNKAGTTQTYGTPEAGKTYTIELGSANYIIHSITAVYGG